MLNIAGAAADEAIVPSRRMSVEAWPELRWFTTRLRELCRRDAKKHGHGRR
jgi:hypothetical protein